MFSKGFEGRVVLPCEWCRMIWWYERCSDLTRKSRLLIFDWIRNIELYEELSIMTPYLGHLLHSRHLLHLPHRLNPSAALASRNHRSLRHLDPLLL